MAIEGHWQGEVGRFKAVGGARRVGRLVEGRRGHQMQVVRQVVVKVVKVLRLNRGGPGDAG